MAIDKRLVVVVIHIVVCFEWMNIRKSIRLCLRRAGIRVNGDGLFVCSSYRWRQRRTELRVFVCSVCTHLANIESNSPDSEQHQSCFSPAVSFATCVREKEREIDYQKRQLRRGFWIFTTHKFPLNSSFFTSGSPSRNTFLFSCYSDSVCYWRQTICLIAAWQATNDVISTKLYIFINRTSMLHTRYFISGVCALLRCDNKWISSVPSIYRHRKRIYWNCEGTIKTEKKAHRRSEVSDNYELVRAVRAACV